MRVTLVISSLGGGGAERVLTTLANYWAEAGWTVTTVTIADDIADVQYPIDRRVRVTGLSMRSTSTSTRDAIASNLGRLRALRNAIRRSKPDGVISFMTENNVLTRIATLGLRGPVIVSERVVYQRPSIPRSWRILRPFAYFLSTAIVMQTRDSVGEVPRLLRPKVRVIPNPVPSGPLKSTQSFEGRKQLMAMGRLSPEKGFDLLLQAFARIAPLHPDWNLAIWGEGALKEQLTQQRDDLDLTSRVSIPGPTRTPREQLAASDLFVLSSRYEGFPNVLCEAMATGLPVVSFDCRFGPSEIIRNNVDGLLVPTGDVDALVAALDRLMSDDVLRDRLGAAAVSIIERYSLANVAAQWEALLKAR
ncbi:glycosyltransferase family 4 protein [soil metagenome]